MAISEMELNGKCHKATNQKRFGCLLLYLVGVRLKIVINGASGYIKFNIPYESADMALHKF